MRLLEILLVGLVIVSVIAGNASCQEQDGLSKSEAKEVFDLVDTLEYDLTICKIQSAYQDSLHTLEIKRLESYWEKRGEELRAEKRQQFLYAGIITVISAVSVWVGANSVR